MTPLETFTLAAYFFVLVILAGTGGTGITWSTYMKNKDNQPVPDATFENFPPSRFSCLSTTRWTWQIG